MDFAFSEEQELLRSSAREFLAEQYPLERVGEIVDNEPGWAAASWKQIADLGWLDAELELLDHVVVFEETGYGLLPAPMFATVGLALPAIERSADHAELRAAVAAGELRLTLAWAEDGRPMDLRDAAAACVSLSEDGAVSGHTVLVPDAGAVDAVVVATTGGLRLVRAADATITPRATVDRSRRLADVAFADAPSTPLVAPSDVPTVLVATERRALVLAAAEAIGVARRAIDIAVDHASTREQFGKPIGAYQAVSHQIVDAYAATELARSLTYWAAWTVSESHGMADAACSAAKSRAAEAAVHACERAIQVCGGIGFTWEHVLHRLYKRALWLEAFDGHGRTHRARVADAVL